MLVCMCVHFCELPRMASRRWWCLVHQWFVVAVWRSTNHSWVVSCPLEKIGLYHKFVPRYYHHRGRPLWSPPPSIQYGGRDRARQSQRWGTYLRWQVSLSQSPWMLWDPSAGRRALPSFAPGSSCPTLISMSGMPCTTSSFTYVVASVFHTQNKGLVLHTNGDGGVLCEPRCTPAMAPESRIRIHKLPVVPCLVHCSVLTVFNLKLPLHCAATPTPHFHARSRCAVLLPSRTLLTQARGGGAVRIRDAQQRCCCGVVPRRSAYLGARRWRTLQGCKC